MSATAGFDEPTTSAPASRVAAKVTVNLSQKAFEALEDAADITKDTKTDVINKALQLYNEVRAAQEADGGIWIQADKSSEAVKLRLY